jgi:hypothetical protein
MSIGRLLRPATEQRAFFNRESWSLSKSPLANATRSFSGINRKALGCNRNTTVLLFSSHPPAPVQARCTVMSRGPTPSAVHCASSCRAFFDLGVTHGAFPFFSPPPTIGRYGEEPRFTATTCMSSLSIFTVSRSEFGVLKKDSDSAANFEEWLRRWNKLSSSCLKRMRGI